MPHGCGEREERKVFDLNSFHSMPFVPRALNLRCEPKCACEIPSLVSGVRAAFHIDKGRKAERRQLSVANDEFLKIKSSQRTLLNL